MSLERRDALTFTLLLMSLFTVLLAPAHAQTPNTRIFQVDATITPPQTIEERFGSRSVFLNITVNEVNPSPLSSTATILITVNRTQPNPVYNGWSISCTSSGPCPNPTATYSIPGTQRTPIVIEFRVELTAENPDDPRIPLQFEITARPQFQGSNADPLLGGSSPANQASSTRESTEVRRELEAAEALTSFVFQNAWVLAIAALAIIVVVGVLLRGRRKSGVAVSTENVAQEMLPGRGASFPIVITNLGPNKESVVLGTSDVPSGWSAILPVEKLELRGNESTTLWLTLKSPPSAKPGESIQVAFIATGNDGTATEARLEAVVVERLGEAQTDGPSTPPRPMRASRSR